MLASSSSFSPPLSIQPPALSVAHFRFEIDQREILRDISFEIQAGESVALIGPNGAGKSTLLKCLDRLIQGGAGEIQVFGRRLSTYRQLELARVLAYVPQTEARLMPFTVAEFVAMGRYPHGTAWSGIQARDRQVIRDALEMTGAAPLAQRLLSTLSGGERQQVHIAAALAQEPRILLLDEPTTFLDYKHQDEVAVLLHRINRQSGITLLSVHHDLNRAVLFSSRIIALRAGQIRFDGPAEQIMNREILREIYEMTFEFVAHPQTGMPVIVPAVWPS